MLLAEVLDRISDAISAFSTLYCQLVRSGSDPLYNDARIRPDPAAASRIAVVQEDHCRAKSSFQAS